MHTCCHVIGNYGNHLDGVSKPSSTKKKKKDGENEEEENELIQNSSEDEADEEADLVSVSSTPLMKPVITDRWGQGSQEPKMFRKLFWICLIERKTCFVQLSSEWSEYQQGAAFT